MVAYDEDCIVGVLDVMAYDADCIVDVMDYDTDCIVDV